MILSIYGVRAGSAAPTLPICYPELNQARKTDKKAQEAKISKVDAKKGTVALKMHDKDKGKEVEKTFKLAEDIEYMDSTGKVATVDIFTSGDLVLVIEREGMIAKMKKHDKSDTKKSRTASSRQTMRGVKEYPPFFTR